MGRSPVWRLSSLCVPHDGFGTGDVDDCRVLDRGMDMAMWCAETDRGSVLRIPRPARATCRHGPVPIRQPLILLLGGLFILWSCTRFNSKLPFYALLLIAPAYYSVRVPNFWSGENLVNMIEKLDATRTQSLGYCFYCENLLIRKAMQQPLWGWGSWGESRPKGPDGRDMAPTDGLWIIYLAYYGCFGLFSWTTVLLLPPWLFLVRYPVQQWKTYTVGPMVVIAAFLVYI